MKIGWRGALGLLLSAGLLYWTLHQVRFGEVWHELQGSNLGLFLLSSLAATLIFPLRAWRWRIILDPVEPDIPLGPLWRSVAVGMMVNNTVPARAGEVARAYALTREVPRVPFSASFASLAVDRLFDAIVLFGLMFAAMLSPAFPAAAAVAGRPISSLAIAALALIGVMVVGLYGVAFFPHRLIRIYELFARKVAPRFEAHGRNALLAFAAGLGVLRRPRRFASVLWWTVLHWFLNGVAFWLGFRAVGVAAPLSAAFFVQGLIALGVAVPQAPGFFGVFEAIAIPALAVYGIDKTHAVSWAIGYHVLSFIPITVIGAWYFVGLGLHFGDIGAASRGGRARDEPGAPGSDDRVEPPLAAVAPPLDRIEEAR